MKFTNPKLNFGNLRSINSCQLLSEQLQKQGLLDAKFSSFVPLFEYLFSLFENYKTSSSLDKASNNKPFVLGLLGPQGSGKSSLSRYLCMLFEQHKHIKAQSISIDDFYLPFEERMARGIKYRGPPGTHDMSLLSQYFEDIERIDRKTLCSPVFDKGLHNGQGDRIALIDLPKPDLVIFEGWFAGLRSLPTIQTEVNLNLMKYEKFWNQFNALVVLKPESFDYSFEWRIEAEKLNKSGQMTQEELRKFVSFFIEALDPSTYYGYLQQVAPHFSYPVILIEIDFSHAARSFRVISQDNC